MPFWVSPAQPLPPPRGLLPGRSVGGDSFPPFCAIFPGIWQALRPPSNHFGDLSTLAWVWTCRLHTRVLATSTYMGVYICPAPPSPSETPKRHSLSLRPCWGFLPASLGRYVCTCWPCRCRPVCAVLADALNRWASPQCLPRMALHSHDHD